jgi:hypothetical protein
MVDGLAQPGAAGPGPDRRRVGAAQRLGGHAVSERIEVDPAEDNDDSPWCVGVISGGGPLDGREVRIREAALPHGFCTQPQPDWSAYLAADPMDPTQPPLPPPIRWHWTGRIDRHGRAVFEQVRPCT